MRYFMALFVAVSFIVTPTAAQQAQRPANPSPAPSRETENQQLRREVDALRTELAQLRLEMSALKREVSAALAHAHRHAPAPAPAPAAPAPAPAPPAPSAPAPDAGEPSPAVLEWQKRLFDTKPIGAGLISKTFRRMDVAAGDGSDRIVLFMTFQNNSGKDISAFSGDVIFSDQFDDPIMTCEVKVEKPIKNKDGTEWIGSVDYNQFMERDRRLKDADSLTIRSTLKVKTIIFADGTRQTFEPQE